MATIGSSIICMDHINFESDVKICEKIGIDYLHLDVMDGHYVPRYGIYPEIVHRISEITDLKMDLHLMVSDVDFAIKQFRSVKNIEYVSIHFDENEKDFLKHVDQIRNIGKKPGVVINLTSDIAHITNLIETGEVEALMLMGIHPGVLTQTARPEVAIQNLTKIRNTISIDLPEFMQIDGGVTLETIPKLSEAGVTNFVCGSSTLYKNVSFDLSFEERFRLIQDNYNNIVTALRS